MRRSVRAFVAVVAVGALVATAARGAAVPHAQAPDPARLGSLPVTIHDRVLPRGPVARVAVARARAAAHGGYYTTRTGEKVRVLMSDSYAIDDAVSQAWANFFAGLIHGPELGTVTIYISPLGEMRKLCGDEFDACYDLNTGTIFLDGRAPPDGRPLEEIAVHEYGHHIANNRSNPPWRAYAWGPKAWASYEGVCQGSVEHRMFPGDDGVHYYENPGEGWAEAYRVANGGRAQWNSGKLFLPDRNALDAVKRDVLSPWTGSSVELGTGRFRPGGARRQEFDVSTPLDGSMSVSLRSGRGLDADLDVFDGHGRRIARSATYSGREQARFNVCGERTVRIYVVASRGSGRYDLTISKP